MSFGTATGRGVRAEHGFTLVELLVVMVAGIVVLSALFTILDVTLHQTTSTFSTVDASQQVRSATEQIESELHSACFGPNVAPIQSASSSTSLSFVTLYGSTAANAHANDAMPTPALHTITFDPTAKTLTDTTTQASSGSGVTWTFAGTSSTRTLLTNVTSFPPASGSSTPVPAFQYFAYSQPARPGGGVYTDGGGNPYEMLVDGVNAVPATTPAVIPPAAPLAVPLSSTDATTAAEVLIRLLVMPAGGSNENSNLASAAASVSDQVVLRLTPPPNHAGTGETFAPCQ